MKMKMKKRNKNKKKGAKQATARWRLPTVKETPCPARKEEVSPSPSLSPPRLDLFLRTSGSLGFRGFGGLVLGVFV